MTGFTNSGQRVTSAVVALLALNTILLIPVHSKTDIVSAGNIDHKILISVHFPDGQKKSTTVEYLELSSALNRKKMPAGITIGNYTVDKWVYAALQKMELNFDGKTIRKKKDGSPFPNRTTITKIGEYENGPNGKWVLYINGRKSGFAIDQQSDDDHIKRIKYVYVSRP